MKKIVWFFTTCATYMCLSVGFWLVGGDMHSDMWYLEAALPVFLFSMLLYILVRRMEREYQETVDGEVR